MSESTAAGAAAPASAAPAESAQQSAETNATGTQAAPESAEAVQEALESGEISKAEANKLIKKFQLKVRGQTKEVEANLGDDEWVKNQLQLAEMSRVSMQESAELKKAYQKEMERFKQNPWEVLQELGFDPDELAESRIVQRIEEMKKSPEQLELEKRDKELSEARAEAKRLKEEKEAIEMDKLRQNAVVELNTEIEQALSGHKSLPNSKYVQRKVAESMYWAMNNGYEDVSAADVIPLVEQEMLAEMNELYDQMPEEVLEKFIGKKNIERMRKKRVAQAKVPPTLNDIKPTSAGTKTESQQQAQSKVASRDFFKNLGKK